LLSFTASAASAAPLLFGPQSFERTAGPPNEYSEGFDVPAELNAIVWIQNGDGDGNRASSARVTINDRAVAGPSDFNKQIDLVAKAVALPRGPATLDVQMNGEPGSVITITIMVQGNRPDFTIGRLVVPYASSTGLTLALKNGARHTARMDVIYGNPAKPMTREEREEMEKASVAQPSLGDGEGP
jgi:hypothetical protein